MAQSNKQPELSKTEELLWKIVCQYLDTWGVVDSKILSLVSNICLEHVEAAIEKFSKTKNDIKVGYYQGIPSVVQKK